MPWRIWGSTGPAVALLHGGSGSWLHWVRNVAPLSAHCRVIVPDLPGLGDAADPAAPGDVGDVVAPVAAGVRELLGDEPFTLAAFSWGATVAGGVAASGAAVRNMLLAGPAALGKVPRGDISGLVRRTPDMTPAEVIEAQRTNLNRLMIHHAANIDALALECQVRNTARARFNSPRFAGSSILLDWLAGLTIPLTIVYGREDSTARPDFAGREAYLRRVRPDLEFDTIAGAGHWVQYEAADAFNRRLLAVVESAGR